MRVLLTLSLSLSPSPSPLLCELHFYYRCYYHKYQRYHHHSIQSLLLSFLINGVIFLLMFYHHYHYYKYSYLKSWVPITTVSYYYHNYTNTFIMLSLNDHDHYHIILDYQQSIIIIMFLIALIMFHYHIVKQWLSSIHCHIITNKDLGKLQSFTNLKLAIWRWFPLLNKWFQWDQSKVTIPERQFVWLYLGGEKIQGPGHCLASTLYCGPLMFGVGVCFSNVKIIIISL